MNSFEQQYQYIRESRDVVLNLLSQMTFRELTSAINEFNGKSVRFLAVHICNVYEHWIGNFALKAQVPYSSEKEVKKMSDLEQSFKQTDALMDHFFEAYHVRWDSTVEGEISNRRLRSTPLQLFTHVITHEFHHKGQIMTMCRLLGQVPPDTDVIRI